MISLLRFVSAGVGMMGAVSGCVRGSLASMSRGYDAQVSQGVDRLRAATWAFHTLDSAVAVGYARDVPDCLVHAHHGAMGFHHVNSRYVDATVDVERPEILLYEPLPSGQYRLNGVEFIVPYRAWPRDSVAPLVMGQQLKHEDNLNIWYLHVWAWTRNSDGLFSDFNPDVTCPASVRKVFTPVAKPPGAPEVLFAGPYRHSAHTARSYDVRPDGSRFLMVRGASDEAPRKVVIVTNWFEELKRTMAR